MTTETKQSVVKWFFEKDSELTILFLEDKITQTELLLKKKQLLDQAKEMEKEQHEKTYLHGFMDDDYVSFDNYWKHEYEGEKGHHKGIFGYLTYGGNK